jgi:hypothetical protein
LTPALASRVGGTLAATLLSLALHLSLYEYAFDDAYIHFRIATHLAEHGAPYFSLDEPVKTSSASGWTLVLSGLLQLTGWAGLRPDLPRSVAILNALMTVTGGVVYTSLLVRLCPRATPLAALGVFFLAYVAVTSWSSVGLMETATALVIAGTAIHLWLGRSRLSLTLLGAAIFWRPEIAVLLGLFWLVSVATRRFSLRDLLAYSALGTMPFVLYEFRFFGTLVPHAAMAKSAAYAMTYPYTLVVFARNLAPELSAWPVDPLWLTLVATAYVFGLLFLVGRAVSLDHELRSWWARRDALSDRTAITLVFFVWGVGLVTAYLVTRTVVAAWYVPLFVVPLLFVWTKTVLDDSATRWARAIGLAALPFWLAQCLGLLQLLFSGLVDPAYYHGFAAGARVRHYVKRGEELYTRYPHACLLTSEIGGLGYGFKGCVVDALGLAYPRALRHHPMAVPAERGSPLIGAIPVGLVEELSPS